MEVRRSPLIALIAALITALITGWVLGAAAPAPAEDLPEVSAQPPWQFHKRNDHPETGYVVYKRKPLGSKFVAYRLEAIIDAPPDVVAAAARNDFVDPEAEQKNIDTTVLRDDADVTVIYSYIHLPLISDRDITTRAERSFDPATGTHRISWRAVNDGPPPKKGVVRLQKSDGSWVFSPAGEQQTRAVYETHTEVAGAMPAWLVNSMLNKSIVRGIARLRAKVDYEKKGDGE